MFWSCLLHSTNPIRTTRAEELEAELVPETIERLQLGGEGCGRGCVGRVDGDVQARRHRATCTCNLVAPTAPDARAGSTTGSDTAAPVPCRPSSFVAACRRFVAPQVYGNDDPFRPDGQQAGTDSPRAVLSWEKTSMDERCAPL